MLILATFVVGFLAGLGVAEISRVRRHRRAWQRSLLAPVLFRPGCYWPLPR